MAILQARQPAPEPTGRPLHRIRRVAVRGLRLLALILAGFLAVLYLIQDRMIFPGAATQGAPEAVVRPRPGSELLQLTTPRGDRVVGLFGPALQANGRPDPDAASRPALLYF